MRKSRFTEAQIIGMIKEQEAGLPTAELCRKHGLSPATFYKLKAKYGGMDLSDAKRLKQLEDENAKLKRLVADGVCQSSCPPISCGVSDFSGADFGFWVEPDGSGRLPVASFA